MTATGTAGISISNGPVASRSWRLRLIPQDYGLRRLTKEGPQLTQL